ncbi:NfeD family protein [Cohnella lupini]|uniref:Membrane protein implicated in regulation of membrane protease activity n=1 Tax=Cohnella lupini TaxID=1294267 RepID=A0A3D9I0R5_9BACL|nr:NfeD family protein [Cohnella lupini]RED54746.1 membrane protein implicated in regulation of membrane protease activity [Cohnella lupini]
MDWWAIWLIVGGVLLIAEMLTLTFYLLWLGTGAVIAAVVALIFPELYLVQALSGGVAALAFTLFTKSITRRFKQSSGYRDAIHELVGKQGVVVEAISPGNPGIVRVGNETWSAISIDVLLKDDEVRVISRGTTVLEVQKWGGSPE